MNKTKQKFLDFQGEVVMCFIAGIGFVIGKAKCKKEEEEIALENPRIAQLAKNTGGILRFPGYPDTLYLTDDSVFVYRPKDKELLAMYVKAISNLVMPNTH